MTNEIIVSLLFVVCLLAIKIYENQYNRKWRKTLASEISKGHRRIPEVE